MKLNKREVVLLFNMLQEILNQGSEDLEAVCIDQRIDYVDVTFMTKSGQTCGLRRTTYCG